MVLRKSSGVSESNGPRVPATLEPLPGHTELEIVDLLIARGADEVTLLGPGFISAQADRGALREAEAIAAVHIKPRHQMHG